MDLIEMNAAATATKELKFVAVVSALELSDGLFDARPSPVEGLG